MGSTVPPLAPSKLKLQRIIQPENIAIMKDVLFLVAIDALAVSIIFFQKPSLLFPCLLVLIILSAFLLICDSKGEPPTSFDHYDQHEHRKHPFP